MGNLASADEPRNAAAWEKWHDQVDAWNAWRDSRPKPKIVPPRNPPPGTTPKLFGAVVRPALADRSGYA
jgi:hypothetical protein